jgi:DNA-binding CsgD family transcriptional regulator/catechol 2,3-dioxygenase-like lactoylglutathione lyase family enzyme
MRQHRSRRGRPPHADVLTPAEWRVVHAFQHGLSYAEIASRLRVSREAVKFHVGNAVAKLGVADRHGLRRWFRAPATSVLARKEQTMTVQHDPGLGPLAQVARTVRDIDESTRWYGQTLGLRHLYSFGALAFFDLAGTRLMLSAQKQPAPESILYLRVGDIRSACAALMARGVQFVQAPHLIHRHADGTEEWLASFTDPEGRPLALLCQLQPPVAAT